MRTFTLIMQSHDSKLNFYGQAGSIPQLKNNTTTYTFQDDTMTFSLSIETPATRKKQSLTFALSKKKYLIH